ncbi:MAG: prepilin-type N-terminal cleavage/methylation domain-containing protein [Methylophaga sp.]|nr:prepilin-type N-terminal cleavage/methylation domain-containing protein [Methylophaga sp.]
MNIRQMKRAISTFRAADVSIIKDDAMRAKAQKLQAKQKGFTLLELLVVITLLATLSVGAMVAYDGIGENASDTAAANSLVAAESAIRNYRAVESEFPGQWDNLTNVDGSLDGSGAIPATNGMGQLLAKETKAFLGQWKQDSIDTDVTTTVYAKVASALGEVGLGELQAIDSDSAFAAGIVPNLALNESNTNVTNPGDELVVFEDDDDELAAQFEDTDITTVALSIFASSGKNEAGTDVACTTTGGAKLDTHLDATTVTNNKKLNLINDAMESDVCSMVIALGYGKDVPGTTIDSRVAIAQVPTVSTTDVNAAENYARAIALFQVGFDGFDGTDADGVISASEIFTKARLVGVVDPEGRAIDTVLAAATK